MVLRLVGSLIATLVLILAAPVQRAAANPLPLVERGAPVPPRDPPATLLLRQHPATPADIQEFFPVTGEPATIQLTAARQPASAKSENSSRVSSSANMEIEVAVCWSEHDYPHLSEHNVGAIDVEVRTMCSQVIDRVHVTGYLWRWSGSQWYLVGSEAKSNYGWYRVEAHPAVGCPGSAAGGFYYTSTGYHEMWWRGEVRWGNSESDKLSWIRCGGPY
jgi:hypothetical protein